MNGVISQMVQTMLGWAYKIIGLAQHVKVQCHRAYILPNGPECYFINVRNASPQRDAEVTHVWITGESDIHVINQARPLPRRLKPEESWETRVEVGLLPAEIREDAYCLARVRLSNGKVLKSNRNKDVPSAGFIPGS